VQEKRGFTSAAIIVMAGGAHKLRGGGVHLSLSQWQGPVITIIATDVNPEKRMRRARCKRRERFQLSSGDGEGLGLGF
jgi:hypothetical protein